MLKSFGVKFVLMLSVIFLLGAGQVWLSHTRVAVVQAFGAVKAEHQMLFKSVQGLRLELTSLMRPDTLRRLARENLGMQKPNPNQVIQP